MPAIAGSWSIAFVAPLRAVADDSLSTFYGDQAEITLKATFLYHLKL